MIEEYISKLEQEDKSPKTIISYRNNLKKFFDDLHILPVRFVTSTDVRKWISEMLNPRMGKPLAITTINRRLNALRSFMPGPIKIKRCSATRWMTFWISNRLMKITKKSCG